MLAEIQPPVRIHRKPVRTWFAAVFHHPGVAGGLHEDGCLGIAFLPLIDRVARDVGEQQTLFLLVPNRALRPIEAGAESFDFRLRIENRVERGIEAFDFFLSGN